MDRKHTERRLTTKNGHLRKIGWEPNKRKTKTDEARLDDGRWIRKAQRGPTAIEWNGDVGHLNLPRWLRTRTSRRMNAIVAAQ